MMEILKVKMQNGNTNATVHIQSSPTLSKKSWLNKMCPVISQSDFDTCGNSYSDGDYHVKHLNGYDREFRTYMNQFEN